MLACVRFEKFLNTQPTGIATAGLTRCSKNGSGLDSAIAHFHLIRQLLRWLICQQMSCAADSRCWKIIVLETIGECEKAVLLNLCVAAAVLEIGSLVAVCVF